MSTGAGAKREALRSALASETKIGGRKRRLIFIDALRALAIISVFYVHGRAFWAVGGQPRGIGFFLDRLAAQGAAGVDLFIVLSGFCMTYPLIDRDTAEFATVEPWRFWKRRAIRLLPAYYVALIVVVALLQISTIQPQLVARRVTAIDVLSTALFVQPFSSSTISAINGPLWSISVEICLYLLFPTTLWLLNRIGWLPLLASSVFVGVAWLVLARRIQHGAAVYWLPGHYFEFVLGMAAASLVCNPVRRQVMVATLFLPVGALVGAAGTVAGVDAVRVLGWGTAAAALTLVASQSDAVRITHSVTRALAPLGVVSYSFYLLHQPAILLTASLVRKTNAPESVLFLMIIPFGILLMGGLAWVFYRALERPFLLSGGMRDAIRQSSRRPAPQLVAGRLSMRFRSLRAEPT